VQEKYKANTKITKYLTFSCFFEKCNEPFTGGHQLISGRRDNSGVEGGEGRKRVVGGTTFSHINTSSRLPGMTGFWTKNDIINKMYTEEGKFT